MVYTEEFNNGDRINNLSARKPLTMLYPNNRELKNEIRWIYCWSLWTELTRQRIRLLSPDLGYLFDKEIQYEIRNSPDLNSIATTEDLISELQSLVISKPIQTLSKVKTLRRIKEIGARIQLWEKVRKEGVVFISFFQIHICGYKTGDCISPLSDEGFELLQRMQDAFMDKVKCACRNMDHYYNVMEELLALFKSFKCPTIFSDPIVSKWTQDCARRRTSWANPTSPPSSFASPIRNPCQRSSAAVLNRSFGSPRTPKTPIKAPPALVDNPDVPDITEPLFATWKSPCKVTALDQAPEACLKRYVELLYQGTSWFFAWCQFSHEVLQEIKRCYPSLGSEVINHMAKHLNSQTNLLKGITVLVSSFGQKIKYLNDSQSQMAAVMTCLSTLDDFVSLIESVKHEASYLIRYVEIELINEGVLDLNREPTQPYPLRVYRIRSILSMKDAHLLASVDYLYQEMAFLLEYAELKFHDQKGYLDKYGQLTADLFKKYTVSRRQVIQDQENRRIQQLEKDQFLDELPVRDNNGNRKEQESVGAIYPPQPEIYPSPISKYQRAEDLRKWVEESAKITKSLSPYDGECPPANQYISDDQDFELWKWKYEASPRFDRQVTPLREEMGDGRGWPGRRKLFVDTDEKRESQLVSPSFKSDAGIIDEKAVRLELHRVEGYEESTTFQQDGKLGFAKQKLAKNTSTSNLQMPHDQGQSPSPRSGFWNATKAGANSLKKGLHKRFFKW